MSNSIVCGDSQDLSFIASESVDCIITSPPYDNLRTYNNSLEWNFTIFSNIAKELERVLKPGGVIVRIVGDQVINGGESLSSFKQAIHFTELGLSLHDTMIREKNTSSFPAKREGNRYTQIFEYMFIFSKGKPKTAKLICDKENKRAGYTSRGTVSIREGDNLKDTGKKIQVAEYSPRNNIRKIQSSKGSCAKDKYVGHPAGFPEELVLAHIQTRTNVGDIILDPFAGSGTTGIVASKTDRKYILVEKEEKFYNIIKKQLDSGLFI